MRRKSRYIRNYFIIFVAVIIGGFIFACAPLGSYPQQNTFIESIPPEDFSNSELLNHTQNAKDPWTSTKIFFKPGDKAYVTVSGRWCMAGVISCTGPNGSGRKDSVEVKGLPFAALIGRLPDGKPFLIGSNLAFRVLKEGYLSVTVNNSHKIIGNNQGEMHLEIRIKRASSTPEIQPITKPITKSKGERVSVAALPLDAGPGIKKETTLFLTDFLMNSLVSTGAFSVLDRKNMDAILKEQGFQMSGCTSSECQVEVGRLLGVEYMINGSIGKLGKSYIINLQIVNVETGQIEGTASDTCACEVDGLPAKIQTLSSQLAGTPLSK